MTTTVITGGSSGLGAAIKAALPHGPQRQVYDWSVPRVDITDAGSIAFAVQALPCRHVDILINNAGVNEVNYLPNMTEEAWDRVMGVNAKGIFLTSKALLPLMRGGTILNIVSNAARVPMTSSIAYNASKGAALMITKQMARELKVTHDITVFSVSPGKIKGTAMSAYVEQRVTETRGWSEKKAKEYQLAALAAGEEIDPATLAEFIAFLLSTKERHKFLAGQDVPYGG